MGELTNANFAHEIASAPYMVLLARYPWCKHCKTEFQEVFTKTARNDTLKGKVVFAKVDLREQRWVGRELSATCSTECTKNLFVFRQGVNEGTYNSSFTGEKEKIDEDRDSMVAYFTRHCRPAPWPLSSMSDVDEMKGEGDKVMPIGIFGDGPDKEKAEFQEYAV